MQGEPLLKIYTEYSEGFVSAIVILAENKVSKLIIQLKFWVYEIL